MKTFKGIIGYYFATGEIPHFYVWTGDPKAEQYDWEHHEMIYQHDLVHIKTPEGDNMIIFPFPKDLKSLKKLLKKKEMERLIKATQEGWNVEVCRLDV